MQKELPWEKLIIEGTVIVGSILLAFAIDAWWAERIDRQTEQSILTRLHADLINGQKSLDERDFQIKSAAEANKLLTDMLSTDFKNADINVLADLFSRSTLVGFTPDDINHHATYLEVRDSGRLSLIRSQGLREEIAEYFRSVDVLSSVWNENPGDISKRYTEITGFPPIAFNILGTEEIKLRIFNELQQNTEITVRELRRLQYYLTVIQFRMDAVRENNLILLKHLE